MQACSNRRHNSGLARHGEKPDLSALAFAFNPDIWQGRFEDPLPPRSQEPLS